MRNYGRDTVLQKDLMLLLVAVLAGLMSLQSHADEKNSPESMSFPIDSKLVKTLSAQLSSTDESPLVMLKGYPLPDGSTATLSFHKFSLWAPEAEIIVFDGKQALGEGQPRGILQLLGRAKEDPAVVVQLRMTQAGLTGFVMYQSLLYSHTFVEVDGNASVTFEVEISPPFETGEQSKVGLKNYLSTIQANASLNKVDMLNQYCCVGGPSGDNTHYLDLAVETDDELFQRLQSLSAIQTEVENIIAGVNTIYYRDIEDVLFRLKRLAMYTDGTYSAGQADPFYGTSNDGVIRELRDFWNDPGQASQRQRFDVGVLLSGKDNFGGSSIFPPWVCEGGSRHGQWCSIDNDAEWASCSGGACVWEGVSVCEPHKAYVVLHHRETVPTIPMDAVDALEINVKRMAHELGHLFGAEHKHCILEAGQFIDRCRSGAVSLRLDRCYVGPEYSPFDGVNEVMGVCGERIMEFHQANRDLIRQGVTDATCLEPARVAELQNGVAVHNLSSTFSSTPLRQYFTIDVPASATSLTVETFSGTGELALYARYGTLVGPFGNEVSAIPGTTNQTIVKQSPRAGRWFVMLVAGSMSAQNPSGNPFQNVSLIASY